MHASRVVILAVVAFMLGHYRVLDSVVQSLVSHPLKTEQKVLLLQKGRTLSRLQLVHPLLHDYCSQVQSIPLTN